MFGIGFFKGQPTEYIIKFVGGRVAQEGQGLAFFYLGHNTQIVAVPTSSADVSFIFNETSREFQDVTIQGQLTYRVQVPRQVAALLNFTVDPHRHVYLSDDPEHLAQRITNVVQRQTRSEIQARSLEETLRDFQEIAAAVLRSVREGEVLQAMGVELLSLYFLGARPTPEVGKALEAGYRETLLRRADEAIYARRAAAVEEERKIKENELNTAITLEQQRQELIGLQGANAQQEAEHRGRERELEAGYRARATELELAPYRTLDPRRILALGMRELGQNAEQIGNLTITSELLASLLNGTGAE
jgi:SPFH domain / Band 7 family